VLGDGWRLEQALQDSEDSVKLNTSFVERLNLTIRQGSAYLSRRTICQARWKETSRRSPRVASLPLQFSEAPSSVEIWTRSQNTSPTGWVVTNRTLTLREIFSSRELFLASKNVVFALFETARLVSFPIRRHPLAA
jgi:hypothetical protein